MGRRYQYDWKVTRYQRPQWMTIESTSGPFPTTLEYHLVEREDGTEVRFTVTGQPTGVMRLLQPVLARTTQHNLDRNFPRLQSLLNSGAASKGAGDTPSAG